MMKVDVPELGAEKRAHILGPLAQFSVRII